MMFLSYYSTARNETSRKVSTGKICLIQSRSLQVLWRGSKVSMQRLAKPRTLVQIQPPPPSSPSRLSRTSLLNRIFLPMQNAIALTSIMHAGRCCA